MYFYQLKRHIQLTKKIDLDLITNINIPLSLIGKYSSHRNKKEPRPKDLVLFIV